MEELFECSLRSELLANIWHDVIKVATFNELCHNIETALESALNVDLRERRPLRVEFEPLADALVAQDVKRLDVAVLARLKRVDKTPGKFAFRSV